MSARWLSLGVLLYCVQSPAADSPAHDSPAYREWQTFKKEFAEYAAGQTGMYAIQDMIEIDPGEIAYLSGAKNPDELHWSKDVVANAPVILKTHQVASVEYKDKKALLRGAGLQGADLLLQQQEPLQLLPNGLTVRVSRLGDALKVWLYNPKLPGRRSFKGLAYFPFDERGVVEGAFSRNVAPIPVSYVDSRERAGTMYVMGTLAVQIDGRKYDLKAHSYNKTWNDTDALLFLLKDRTSGKTTYEGGRVVEVHFPKGAPPATLKLNLNTAYSFLCAHSDYFNCPLVLTNKVDAELRYGEKYPPL